MDSYNDKLVDRILKSLLIAAAVVWIAISIAVSVGL